MPFINVGKKKSRSSYIERNIISGIEPHEFSALKNIESPIQGQIDEIWNDFELLREELVSKIKSLTEELIIANDRVNAGETPLCNPLDGLYALIDKNGIVVKIIIWNEESTYTPDLKLYPVKISNDVKIGMLYKDKRFFKNNIFTKIYLFFKGIK